MNKLRKGKREYCKVVLTPSGGPEDVPSSSQMPDNLNVSYSKHANYKC